MSNLKEIIQMLEEERERQYAEVDKCNELGYKFAAQYASGKTTAFNYAIDLLTAYMKYEIPFES